MVKFGIIGLGGIASKFAHDLKLVDGVELAAVGSRNLKKAQQFADEHGAPSSYGSYNDLFNDAVVDIIYVATPHHLHFENTMSALHAGKSVICEKPFALNIREVQEMIALAQSKNLFLMEAMWTRFIPATLKVGELILNKVIGDIKVLDASFGFRVPADKLGRLNDPEMGGGSLLDIGIYPIFLSLFLSGKPEKITATAQIHNNTDRQCALTLTYKNSISTLKSSFECNLPMEAVIYGSHGSIKMHAPFHECSRITVTNVDGTEETLEMPITGLGYCHEIEEARDCLNNNQVESKKMTWAASLELMNTLDEVRRQIGLTHQL